MRAFYLQSPLARVPHPSRSFIARWMGSLKSQASRCPQSLALWDRGWTISALLLLLLTALNLMADRLRSYFDLREVKL